MTLMRRNSIGGLFDSAPAPHAGLWLSRGLREWKDNATKKGEDFQAHVKKTTEIQVPEIYRKAYARWENTIANSGDTIATWYGKLDGRLFIGLGGASVLETAITLSRTYGVPMIPGSAVKGLVRAYAEAIRKARLPHALDADQCAALFGKVGDTPEESDAGYVLFHDAWWVPDPANPPLAQEIVTVHHPDYYSGKKDNNDKPIKATDFDSPVPNAQLAARGSFLFAVECGDKKWAEYACNLLAEALQHWGIGGKTAAGYGRFIVDKAYQDQIEAQHKAEEATRQAEEDAKLSLAQKQLRDLQRAVEKARQSGNEQAGGPLSGLLTQTIKNALEQNWNQEDKFTLADIAEGVYNEFKWWGNSNKKQEKKERIARLRAI